MTVKRQAIDWGKYRQITHPITDLYPEYVKKSYKSVRSDITQLKNGQKFEQTFHQKMYTNGQ